MKLLRIWLPVAIGVAGVIYAATRGFDETGIEAAVVMVAAGSSVWFMNFLMRLGIGSHQDRHAEDEARDYFDRHGRWPDDDAGPAGGRRA